MMKTMKLLMMEMKMNKKLEKQVNQSLQEWVRLPSRRQRLLKLESLLLSQSLEGRAKNQELVKGLPQWEAKQAQDIQRRLLLLSQKDKKKTPNLYFWIALILRNLLEFTQCWQWLPQILISKENMLLMLISLWWKCGNKLTKP